MISDLIPTDKGIMFCMVVSCEVKKGKKGGPFLSLVLGDCTGTVEARFWDHDIPVPVGSKMKVKFEANEYNGETQVKIERWRELTEEDAEDAPLSHFIRASKRDRDEMLAEVAALEFSDSGIRHAVRALLTQFREQLRDAPAAMVNHQPYLGGLLEHILSLVRMAENMVQCYPCLDRDVLVAACVFHDIGKIHELTVYPVIAYTTMGSALGHLGLGLQILAVIQNEIPRTIDLDGSSHQVDQTKLNHLAHLVASHHGRQEWGALVEPMSREAHVFHQLDMVDSYMGKFDELEASTTQEFLWQKGSRYWLRRTPAEVNLMVQACIAKADQLSLASALPEVA